MAGLAARLHDLDAAQAAFARALDVAAAADLRVHRLRILNELGTVEMLRDARGDRLEQARSEASRAGAVGLAAGIGINIAALMAMTARFDDALTVAREVEQTAGRLGLTPLQAAALLMQGFAMAHQGRSRDAERCLAAAEAVAPGDPDLRRRRLGHRPRDRCPAVRGPHGGAAGLCPRPRGGPRPARPHPQPLRGARAPAPGAGRRGGHGRHRRSVRRSGQVRPLAGTVVRRRAGGGRWRGGRCVRRGGRPHWCPDGRRRYPVFSALTMRLAAEAAIGDGWGDPGALLRDAETTFTRLRLGRAAAACRSLLKTAGHTAPRRRAADAGLPAALISAGVTAREAEVLDLLADRLSNRRSPGPLFVSLRTVEKHVAALLAKLGGEDRNALARLARSRAEPTMGSFHPCATAPGARG